MLAHIYARISAKAATPWVRQVPIAFFFLLALVTVLLAPERLVTNGAAIVAGFGFALIATVLAVYFNFRKLSTRWILIVPALDLLAIGFLRAGSDPGTSMVGALVVLPVVWFALEYRRRFVAYAFLGAVFAMLLPVVFNTSLGSDTVFLFRSIVTPVIFGIVAIVVNEFSRLWSDRAARAIQRAEERSALLEESRRSVAELAKSEARLRSLERMFRGLWGAVTEQSVIGTDRLGLIDAWNPGAEKMLGFSDNQTEGIRRIDEFHLADELESRSKELNFPPGETVLNPGFSALVEPARLGSADVREWTYVRADGDQLPVELAVTARLNESGEIIGYLFVANDVSKAKELARLKDEFVGLISHELRTPLSSIIGYLELLRDEGDADLNEQQLHYLSVAERNAQRLLGLVGDLLFTAQVDSGMFRVDLTEQRLDTIVAASVESASPAAARTGITLTADIAPNVTVCGDAVRIGQACDNLISNALKFTRASGTVTVSVSADGESATVAVRDTGMGIAQAELDKLFSRFFRASTATRNAVPGVGLGLVITKAIVTAHGGKLDVTSEEGVGTCFTMTLPRHPAIE